MSNGRIKVGTLFKQAIQDDTNAIKKLFSGFLSEDESIVACGYLGVVGFIFAERSFWCVTDSRVCALLIKRGGQVIFRSGFLKYINSFHFYQPSLVLLWVIIIGLAISTFGISLLLTPWIIRGYYRLRKSGCVFWIREGLPIYVFADRSNLIKAQKVIAYITELKLKVELGIIN